MPLIRRVFIGAGSNGVARPEETAFRSSHSRVPIHCAFMPPLRRAEFRPPFIPGFPRMQAAAQAHDREFRPDFDWSDAQG